MAVTLILVTQPKSEVTKILERAANGDQSAMAELMPHVYDELRRLARSYLKRERASHTLQPTALVHEAYLRLVKSESPDWKGRTHFLACVAGRVPRGSLRRGRLDAP